MPLMCLPSRHKTRRSSAHIIACRKPQAVTQQANCASSACTAQRPCSAAHACGFLRELDKYTHTSTYVCACKFVRVFAFNQLMFVSFYPLHELCGFSCFYFFLAFIFFLQFSHFARQFNIFNNNPISCKWQLSCSKVMEMTGVAGVLVAFNASNAFTEGVRIWGRLPLLVMRQMIICATNCFFFVVFTCVYLCIAWFCCCCCCCCAVGH